MSEETTQPSEAPAATEATTEATTTEGATTSYLDGKYDSVSGLEQGYKELQSSYSSKTAEYSKAMQGKTGAPEAYEYGEGITVSEGMEAYAREQGYSNDALNELAGAYNADRQEQSQAYATAQREILGKDAEARLTNVGDWLTANAGEQAGALRASMTSAEAIIGMERLMKQGAGTQAAAVAQPASVVDRDTLNAMRYEVDRYGERKMSSDPQHRAKVQGLMEQFVADGGKL